jgi:hypothetical protein
MTLPGIGEALRSEDPPMPSHTGRKNEDWVQKKIIPEATYDKISSLIIAKQPAASTTTKPTTTYWRHRHQDEIEIERFFGI